MQKPDRLLRSFWKRQIKNSEETNKELGRDKYRSIEAYLKIVTRCLLCTSYACFGSHMFIKAQNTRCESFSWTNCTQNLKVFHYI